MKMYKTISTLTVFIFCLVFISDQAFGQNATANRKARANAGKSKNLSTKDVTKLKGNYMLIKATEKKDEKWKIEIDYGKDKEIYNTDKEKEIVDEVLKNENVIDLINVLNYRGWSVDNSYVLQSGKETLHYFLLKKEQKTNRASAAKKRNAAKSQMPRSEKNQRRQQMMQNAE